jgi:hypothetical protein
MKPAHLLSPTILALALASALSSATSLADVANLTHVPNANQKMTGMVAPNILSPGLIEVVVAQGSTRLENPSPLTSYYGYINDGPMLPTAGATQNPGANIEATKTEPDKNTYGHFYKSPKFCPIHSCSV